MIKEFKGISPEIDSTAFIADDAVVIGDVHIGVESSIWFKCVVRGDVNFIRIGNRTNIQDNSVLHVTTHTHPLIIGNEVTAGHRVILHGCTIHNRVLVGMGAIVLDGAVVEEDSLIAAGSVIPPGSIVPSGKLVMGIPAKVKRDLTSVELEEIKDSSENYVKNSRNYIYNF